MDRKPQNIAFVGLGSMGLPMATSLVRAGFPVAGFDIRPAAASRLAERGGTAASSASEAATGASVLVLMVVDVAQAEAVLFEEGAIDALEPRSAICLMSTCPPDAVEKLAARIAAREHDFVDCPVSGGVAGAEASSLTIMAACPKALFDELSPLLSAIGSKLHHVGEKPGQGAVVKSINQLLCGVHLAAAAEALALGAKVGLDTDDLLGIVSGSAASSWMLRDRGERMLAREPEVTSAIDIFVKDLGIVMEAGRDAKAALPLAATAHQLFLSASGAGDGACDDSQVIRAYRRINAID